MARQLSFDLPPQVALGADDFFVSTANERAYAMVMDWATWPLGKLVLIGPLGSGKSHLARVWQGLTGAQVLDAAGLVADEAVGVIAGDDAGAGLDSFVVALRQHRFPARFKEGAPD